MMKSQKQIIRLDEKENIELPLSLAVRYGSLVFVSGTVSLDLETRKPLLGSVEYETERILLNIEKVLKAAGSSLDCVLKTQVFLTDIKFFPRMNEVYKKFFPKGPPARSTIGIQLAGDYKLEIEAVAYIPEK